MVGFYFYGNEVRSRHVTYLGQWEVSWNDVCHSQKKLFETHCILCNVFRRCSLSLLVSTVWSRVPSQPWRLWAINKPLPSGITEVQVFLVSTVNVARPDSQRSLQHNWAGPCSPSWCLFSKPGSGPKIYIWTLKFMPLSLQSSSHLLAIHSKRVRHASYYMGYLL